MQKIVVKSQQEFDALPQNFVGCVYIDSPPEAVITVSNCKRRIIVRGNSSVEARGDSSIVASGNSSVIAWENSSVEARGDSSIVASGNSSVIAWENSSVEARGNSSVVASGNSSVIACENSSVDARGNSSVVAWGDSSVIACENSSVDARGNSSVVAWGDSSVIACENSSVAARGNSSVVARGNSSVIACENSSVEAGGNGPVVAQGNCQIVKRSDSAKLEISGNARIVNLPSTLEEYCDFYGVEIHDGKAILYKAVRNDLTSFYDPTFLYTIGGTKENRCDPSALQACSYGLHVSPLLWAVDFGLAEICDLFKILECSVPLDKVIVPLNSAGKVRTSELTVLREVPSEEWGVQGKIYIQK